MSRGRIVAAPPVTSAVGAAQPADAFAAAPVPPSTVGTVRSVTGLVVRAQIAGVELGEVVEILRAGAAPVVPAEVVGFDDDHAVLMALGVMAGIAVGTPVRRTHQPLRIACGPMLLGRVVDGLGAPIDGGEALGAATWAVDRRPPDPMSRPSIRTPFATGLRAIDGLLPLGRGQRIGVFAGAGIGKSTLLGQITRGADADVCVVCLVGERGRELADLLGDLPPAQRQRTVVVCATADAPSLTRVRAVSVATAIAEWFRDQQGAHVLLVVDSLTRVARAQREVGLSAGEPVARHGYPPSVFALLPQLVERAGCSPHGAITALYAVLVASDDLDEPISDEVRGLLDGHLVLSRALAGRGHYPPIDVPASVSRLAPALIDAAHARAIATARQHLARYDEQRDLILLGAYKAGADPRLDAAVRARPALDRFLAQPAHERTDRATAVAQLAALATAHPT